MNSTTEKDLFYAVRSGQSEGMLLEEFLKEVKRFWIIERQEQLARESKVQTTQVRA